MSQILGRSTAASMGAVSTITTDDLNVVVPSSGNIYLVGAHGINTSGVVANTASIQINNAITLGDLSSISGSNALTVSTGNIELSAGSIKLPSTVSDNRGVILFSGTRYLHGRGLNNVFAGPGAGNYTLNTSSAEGNAALGYQALSSLTTGNNNTAIGTQAIFQLLDGIRNVSVGHTTLTSITSGNYNIALGYSAGSNLTGSNSHNILIGNTGTNGDSRVMRLGTTGVGVGQVTTAFIAGTYGVTPAGASIKMVVMDSSGQAGTQDIPSGLQWIEVTATSANMSSDKGYLANNVAQVDLALPASAAKLSILRVKGFGAGGWKISQAAGQSIIWDESSSTTTGAGGYLESTGDNDAVELICVVANLQWSVLSSKGNITVV